MAVDVALEAAQVLEDARSGSDVTKRAEELVEADLPLFLHTVVAADGLEDPQIVSLLKQLQISPEALATYLGPTQQLSDVSLVDPLVLKRQNQTINAQTTKILTYDLARECSAGYARLFTQPSKLGEIFGTFRLEPYKVLDVLVDRLGRAQDARTQTQLVTTFKTQGWTREAIVMVVRQRVNGSRLRRSRYATAAAGLLLGHKILELEDAYAIADPGDALSQVGVVKKEESPGVNSLAMAAALPDSDEEDEYNEEDDEMITEERDTEERDIEEQGEERDEERDEEMDTEERETEERETEERESVERETEERESVERETEEPEDVEPPKTGCFLQIICQAVSIDPQPLLPLFARYPNLAKLPRINAALNKGVTAYVAPLKNSSVEELMAEAHGDATQLVEVTSLAQLEILAPVWLKLCEPLRPDLVNAIASGILAGLKQSRDGPRPDLFERLMVFLKRYFIFVLFGPVEVRKSARKVFSFASKGNPDDTKDHSHMLYSLLSYWYYDLCKTDERAKEASQKTEHETRSVLRRITDKLTLQITESLDELIQRDPMSALVVIVGQAENYDKIATLLPTMAQKQLPRMVELALPLVILDRLSLGRSGRSDDGLFPRKWLVLMTRMLTELGMVPTRAASFRMYFRIEPIANYLLALIRDGRHDYLYMFHEFVAKLGDAMPLTNIGLAHLEGIMYRGVTRRRVLKSLGHVSAPQYAVEALDTAIWPKIGSWVVGLGLLVSQIQLAATQNTSPSTARQLAVYYDETSETLSLLIDFIHRQHESVDLPSFGELVKLGVPLPFAFAAWRPYLDNLDVSGVVGDEIDHDLYRMFWSLSGYDVSFDDKIYETTEEDAQVQQRERLAHKLRYSTVSMQIKTASKQWFSTATNFVELCVLPRAVQSPLDALFTSRFVDVLVNSVPDEIAKVLAEVFSQTVLVAVLASSTPGEVDSFAVFVQDTLQLQAKRANKAVEQWHLAFVRAIQQCIDAENLQAIPAMNAIQLTSKVLGEFPVLRSHGAAILARVEPLTLGGPEDVRTAANSLVARLKLREPHWTDVFELPEPKLPPKPEPKSEPTLPPKPEPEPKLPAKPESESKPSTSESTIPDRSALPGRPRSQQDKTERPRGPRADRPRDDRPSGQKRPSEEPANRPKTMRPGYEHIFEEQSTHISDSRPRRRYH